MECNTYISGRGEPIIQIDSTSLNILAVVTAANMIEKCQKNSDLTEIFSMNASAYTEYSLVNALLTQAEFLYSLVESKIKVPESPGNNFLRSRGIPEIITDALETFQEWKTRYCEYNEETSGEKFASATYFYRKNWIDLNEEFLATYS